MEEEQPGSARSAYVSIVLNFSNRHWPVAVAVAAMPVAAVLLFKGCDFYTWCDHRTWYTQIFWMLARFQDASAAFIAVMVGVAVAWQSIRQMVAEDRRFQAARESEFAFANDRVDGKRLVIQAAILEQHEVLSEYLRDVKETFQPGQRGTLFRDELWQATEASFHFSDVNILGDVGQFNVMICVDVRKILRNLRNSIKRRNNLGMADSVPLYESQWQLSIAEIEHAQKRLCRLSDRIGIWAAPDAATV